MSARRPRVREDHLDVSNSKARARKTYLHAQGEGLEGLTAALMRAILNEVIQRKGLHHG